MNYFGFVLYFYKRIFKDVFDDVFVIIVMIVNYSVFVVYDVKFKLWEIIYVVVFY